MNLKLKKANLTYSVTRQREFTSQKLINASRLKFSDRMIKQLLDYVEQNIVICHCLANKLFASASGFSK